VGGGFWATLQHVNAAGTVAKLELADTDGHPVQVEIPRERHDVLTPRPGERLYVRPRRLRVFLVDGGPTLQRADAARDGRP
jgi:hypothetical protein